MLEPVGGFFRTIPLVWKVGSGAEIVNSVHVICSVGCLEKNDVNDLSSLNLISVGLEQYFRQSNWVDTSADVIARDCAI